jgi:hypothetical protein
VGLATNPQQIAQVWAGSQQERIHASGVGCIARPSQTGCEGLEGSRHIASLRPGDAGSWQALRSWMRPCC